MTAIVDKLKDTKDEIKDLRNDLTELRDWMIEAKPKNKKELKHHHEEIVKQLEKIKLLCGEITNVANDMMQLQSTNNVAAD